MTAGDPVRDYLEKCIALTAARDTAERLASGIRAVARTLEEEGGWQNCYVSGVGPLPPDLAGGRRAIDGKSWPTAQQFHEAIVTWFGALEAARTAWQAIPGRDRFGFQGPDYALGAPWLPALPEGWGEPIPRPTPS
jgi:hypothetical protein